jgi:hypothetical protein
MRWHGFDKVNYKGLKQRRGLGRTLTKQGSVPAEIVGRNRRARSPTTPSIRDRRPRGRTCRVFTRGLPRAVLKCQRLGAAGVRPLAHGDRRSGCRFAAVLAHPSAPVAISRTASGFEAQPDPTVLKLKPDRNGGHAMVVCLLEAWGRCGHRFLCDG